MIQRLPFDTTTPIGYTLGLLIQLISVLTVTNSLKCAAVIGLAILPVLFLLANDLVCDLNIIFAMCSRKKRKKVQFSKKVSQFIQLHSDTIQLSTVYYIHFQYLN